MCDISDILEGTTRKIQMVLDTGAVPTGQTGLITVLIGALEQKHLQK